jgi:hypothetical protein
MSSKKPMSEKETRARLFGWAQKNGCEEDLQKLFDRYDSALKGCTTTEERKAVQAMGIMEFNAFFGKSNIKVWHKDGSSIIVDENNNIKK